MAADLVKRSPNIEDKVFLVTGGAAGVGAGVVRALLSENARHVAFLDIAAREGASLELELTTKFGALKAKFIKCDVSDNEQLSAAYNQVLAKYRRLDVVINNAAVLSVSEHCFKKMVDVNFTGTVYSTLKAMDAMGADKGGVGGTVVNISSLLALNLGSHLPVYAATKTAVLQYSVSMGSEECYKRTQVRVLTVCLGPTDTAILQRCNLQNFDQTQLTSRVPVRQRSGISTVDAVGKLTDYVTAKIDAKQKCLAVFLDLAKAFDTVSIPTLVDKLEHIGIRGGALLIYKEFLTDRTQRVKIGNYSRIRSEWHNTGDQSRCERVHVDCGKR